MANWSDFDYDADDLAGWEQTAPAITDAVKAKARDELRRRLRPHLRPLIQRAGVQEEAFFDAMVTLDSTHEVYQALKEYFLREVLHVYWSNTLGRPGLGGFRGGAGVEATPVGRAKFFDGLLKRDVPDFAEMVRFAMDEDDLAFSATRTETNSAPLWAIA